MTKQTKTTKQPCDDCGRKTDRAVRVYGGGWINRCQRCQDSRDGKVR